MSPVARGTLRLLQIINATLRGAARWPASELARRRATSPSWEACRNRCASIAAILGRSDFLASGTVVLTGLTTGPALLPESLFRERLRGHEQQHQELALTARSMIAPPTPSERTSATCAVLESVARLDREVADNGWICQTKNKDLTLY